MLEIDDDSRLGQQILLGGVRYGASDVPSDDDTPEAALLRQADVDTVRGAIDALPEPFRETLVLRELEELSYREIAEITSAPIGTVMSRLARARALLLAALPPEETGR